MGTTDLYVKYGVEVGNCEELDLDSKSDDIPYIRQQMSDDDEVSCVEITNAGTAHNWPANKQVILAYDGLEYRGYSTHTGATCELPEQLETPDEEERQKFKDEIVYVAEEYFDVTLDDPEPSWLAFTYE